MEGVVAEIWGVCMCVCVCVYVYIHKNRNLKYSEPG